jgi:hypothetical protein
MPETQPSLRLLRVTKVVAQATAWVLGVIAFTTLFALFFHLNQPVGEALPLLGRLEAHYGEGFWILVAITFVTASVGALVCFVVAPLQVAQQRVLEHEFQLQVAERLVPRAMELLQQLIVSRCADVMLLTRLIENLAVEAPKVRRECIELTAVVALLAYKEIEPLEAETVALIALVEQHENTVANATDVVGHARRTLSRLAPRIRLLQNDHGDVTIQARHLLAELETQRAALQTLVGESNIHPIRSDLVRPAE